VTADEALKRLTDPADITFEELDSLFRAFGFLSHSPTFETEVYYHPRFRCGMFTARDDGLHLLSPQQRTMVVSMVQYVRFCENAERAKPRGRS
jgi:hypothetical protein